MNIPIYLTRQSNASKHYECVVTRLLWEEIPRMQTYALKNKSLFPLLPASYPVDRQGLINLASMLIRFCEASGYPVPPQVQYTKSVIATKNTLQDAPSVERIILTISPQDALSSYLNRGLKASLMISTMGCLLVTGAALTLASVWLVVPFLLVTWAMAQTRSLSIVSDVADRISQWWWRRCLGAYPIATSQGWRPRLKSILSLSIVLLNAITQGVFAWVSANLFIGPLTLWIGRGIIQALASLYGLATGLVVAAGSYEPVTQTYGSLATDEKEVELYLNREKTHLNVRSVNSENQELDAKKELQGSNPEVGSCKLKGP